MKMRKLLCILMTVALFFAMSGSGFVLALDNITTGPIGTVEGIVEEKIYSTATLEDDFADDRVMVVLNNAASLKLKTYTAADFPEIQCASVNDLSTAASARVNAKLNGESVASVCAQELGTVVFSDFYEVNTETYNQILCLTLPETGKQNVLAAIKLLMQREDVKYAGPDYVITMVSTIPNDAYYSDQWGHTKIKLPQAWDINTGSSSVLVGVLDSGIEQTHTDFFRRINTARSKDFTGAYRPLEDPNGHGTHVAGIIGAYGNDSYGVTGVMWNVRLVSLRVFDSDGYGYASHVAAAIDYAQSQGIPILNFSGGWSLYNSWFDYDFKEVIDNYSGLFVCAAGNNGTSIENTPIYPAYYSCTNLISVGASTENDTKASFSNYGAQSVDIFAPGESIYSTYRGGIWYSMSGTSMAAPYVTGVAALLLSECPEITVARIKSRILDNVDSVNALSTLCVSGGRLNAYKALSKAHSYTYTYNGYTHTATCSCGDTKTENHSFTQVDIYHICYTCGFITY